MKTIEQLKAEWDTAREAWDAANIADAGLIAAATDATAARAYIAYKKKLKEAADDR